MQSQFTEATLSELSVKSMANRHCNGDCFSCNKWYIIYINKLLNIATTKSATELTKESPKESASVSPTESPKE